MGRVAAHKGAARTSAELAEGSAAKAGAGDDKAAPHEGSAGAARLAVRSGSESESSASSPYSSPAREHMCTPRHEQRYWSPGARQPHAPPTTSGPSYPRPPRGRSLSVRLAAGGGLAAVAPAARVDSRARLTLAEQLRSAQRAATPRKCGGYWHQALQCGSSGGAEEARGGGWRERKSAADPVHCASQPVRP